VKEAIEHFEERAAVIEHMGGLDRIKAESLALREIAPKFGNEAAQKVYAHMQKRRMA
jgi:hypothetical protein